MMLSLALSMAVMTSSGGLLSEHLPAGVRLLDAPSVVPSAMLGRIRDRDRDDGMSRAELQSMSLQQLHEEYDRLEDEKPGIGLGLTLTIVGGGLFFTSLFLWGFVWYSAWIGLLFFIPGVVLCIIGPILLARAIRERRRYNRDQDAIERQIRVLESGGQGGAMPPGPTPPPPPPPPPPMGGLTAVPQVVLASF